MPFTPWSPHLNLPGRHRSQGPTYEELIEARTLPRFIEIPAAPTKNPKSETATSTPDDTGQSTKRRRQEVTFQEPCPTSSSGGAAASAATDSSMVFPGPQIPKPARPLSPAEGEDSIQKRQRPTDVNTVLALAGGDSRIGDFNFDKRSESTTHCESERTSQHGQFWSGGSGRQTTVATSSLDTLGTKTEFGWILLSETRGTGI